MDYDFQKRSDDSAIHFNRKNSLTRQEFVSQCNINNIVNKYVKNGNNPFVITQDAKYGDFTNVPSHQDALDLILRAEDHFMQLPPQLRARFDNDAGLLLQFLGNPNNRQEAIKLGLVQDLNNDLQQNSPALPDIQIAGGDSKA